MKNQKALFSHAASVLPVTDVLQSAKFYCDKLGFDLTFTWGEPVDYAVLKAGPHINVHLTKRNPDHPLPKAHNHVEVYFFMHDIDAFYESVQEKGAEIHTPIGNREYGMRDFDLKDPDGYLLSFGKGTN